MQNDIIPPNRQNKLKTEDNAAPAVDETIVLSDKPDKAQSKRRLRRPRPMDWWRSWSKKRKIITTAVVLVLLVGGGVAAASSFFWRGTEPSLTVSKHKKPAPTTVASPLTGAQVDPALAARPVTGIMIENSLDARPQSGLQDAGVVFEAIAEAGITRFLALFQEGTPQYIGPVRSLRPYYIDYAAPFQAGIVHVGGSPDALAKVQNGNYRNLDQFSNGSYFHRISARAAPHNVYTSFADLDKLNQSKGYTSSKFTTWPRKADKKLAVPTATTLDVSISSPDYYSHYDYDAASNSYNRSEGGAAHDDLVSPSDTAGVKLHPKVVIALVVPQGFGALDASGAYYTDYSDTGSGAAYIFQDGGVTIGQWNKADENAQITFTDSANKPVKLDAGQTWITLVSGSDKIKYTAPPPPAQPAKKQ